MRWEIVGRKPNDRKDTRFQVEAKTSAEAVSDAMSWGWTVKSFHEVGAASSGGLRTLMLGMLSVIALAVVGGGVFLALRPKTESIPANPSPIASQRAPVETHVAEAPAPRTSALPPAPAPAPVASAIPASPFTEHRAAPSSEASAMFETLPGIPELLVATTMPASSAKPATLPAAGAGPVARLTPKAVVAAQVRFVASRLAEPFHLPTCQSAQRISAANLQTFDTREAAIAAGHTPCKVCKP